MGVGASNDEGPRIGLDMRRIYGPINLLTHRNASRVKMYQAAAVHALQLAAVRALQLAHLAVVSMEALPPCVQVRPGQHG